MVVVVNGRDEVVDEAATVGDLLRRFELAPVRVAVEINRDLLSRKQFDATALHDGDRVEIVTFVGGG
ncbi:MAG: sulfur carrier protein ThiS [Phycisphaerales bacterium]|nr:sulfur carrier protein ThiS [Phycisphaerales bacterium]